jgi:hypothetical protein
MELPGHSMITLLCRSTVRLFCCLFCYINLASARCYLYLSVVSVCTAATVSVLLSTVACISVRVVRCAFASWLQCPWVRVARRQLEDVRDGAQRQGWQRLSLSRYACMPHPCGMAHVPSWRIMHTTPATPLLQRMDCNKCVMRCSHTIVTHTAPHPTSMPPHCSLFVDVFCMHHIHNSENK